MNENLIIIINYLGINTDTKYSCTTPLTLFIFKIIKQKSSFPQFFEVEKSISPTLSLSRSNELNDVLHFVLLPLDDKEIYTWKTLRTSNVYQR